MTWASDATFLGLTLGFLDIHLGIHCFQFYTYLVYEACRCEGVGREKSEDTLQELGVTSLLPREQFWGGHQLCQQVFLTQPTILQAFHCLCFFACLEMGSSV